MNGFSILALKLIATNSVLVGTIIAVQTIDEKVYIPAGVAVIALAYLGKLIWKISDERRTYIDEMKHQVRLINRLQDCVDRQNRRMESIENKNAQRMAKVDALITLFLEKNEIDLKPDQEK
jgi:hypothetical protein